MPSEVGELGACEYEEERSKEDKEGLSENPNVVRQCCCMDETEVIKEKEVTGHVRKDEREVTDERGKAEHDRARIESAAGSRPTLPSAWQNLRRLHVWIVLSLVLMLCEGYFLVRSSPGLPSNPSTADGYIVEIGREPRVVSQTFVSGVWGLRAIELWTTASPAHHDGWARVELIDVQDGVLAAAGEVSMTNMFAHSPYRFAFPPVMRSEGRTYRLDIHFPSTFASGMLGLQATRTSTYRGGALMVDGSAVSGDLVFSTDAVGSTALRRFEHAVGVSAGSVAGRALFAIGFVLYNFGLSALLIALVR